MESEHQPQDKDRAEELLKQSFGTVWENLIQTFALQFALVEKGLLTHEQVALQAERLKRIPAVKQALGDAPAPPGLLDAFLVEILRDRKGTVH